MNIEAMPEPCLAPGSLRFIFNGAWWRQAWACAWRFAPRCFVPAVLSSIANIGMMWAVAVLNEKIGWLSNVQRAETLDVSTEMLTSLMFDMVVLFVAVAGSLALMFAGLNMWLVRMHTFGHALSRHGLAAGRAEFARSAAETKFNWVFLFWLVGSLFLLPPVVLMIALVAFNMLLHMPPESTSAMRIPEVIWGISSGVWGFACEIGALLLLLPIVGYTLVAMALGAVGTGSAPKLAVHAFAQTVRFAAPVTAVSFVVCAFNMIAGAPASLPPIFAPALERQLWFVVASQLWVGALSMVLWPLSLAVFFMLTNYARNVAHVES